MYATSLGKPNNRGDYIRNLGRDAAGRVPRFRLGRDQKLAAISKARLEALWDIVGANGGHWVDYSLEIAKAVAAGETSWTVPRNREDPELELDDGEYAMLVADWRKLYGSVIAIIPQDEHSFEAGDKFNRELHARFVRNNAVIVNDENRKATQAINQMADSLGLDHIGSVLDLDTVSLHQAIKAFQDDIKANSPKLPSGNLKPSYRKRLTYCDNMMTAYADMPLWKLDRDKIAECIAYWTNRPQTLKDKACSKSWAENNIAEFDRFTKWLDDSPKYKWTMPKGVANIKRTVAKLDGEKKLSAIVKEVYTPAELATLNKTATDWQRLAIYLSLNCAMGAAELGRLTVSDFALHHPHEFAEHLGFLTSNEDCWLRYFRPKTDVFGEWYLWPETISIVQWAIKRAKRIGSELIFCRDTGKPLYDLDSPNPGGGFTNLWNRIREQTKVADFRKLPLGSMRDTLPDYLRRTYPQSELASICLTHGVPSKADNLLDCYANRPWGRFHAAMRECRQHYAPVFAAVS